MQGRWFLGCRPLAPRDAGGPRGCLEPAEAQCEPFLDTETRVCEKGRSSLAQSVCREEAPGGQGGALAGPWFCRRPSLVLQPTVRGLGFPGCALLTFRGGRQAGTSGSTPSASCEGRLPLVFTPYLMGPLSGSEISTRGPQVRPRDSASASLTSKSFLTHSASPRAC